MVHVDKSHRITGEKLEARGTRGVFLGYKGRTNKLVWILSGGRLLVSPHVITYENTDKNFGWASDPRDIVRSLPISVQRRLNARKVDYAREEDYNRERSRPLQEARGRGRPKKNIQYPFTDDGALLINQNPDDEEMSLNQEDESSEENLVPSIHNQIVKSINCQLYKCTEMAMICSD